MMDGIRCAVWMMMMKLNFPFFFLFCRIAKQTLLPELVTRNQNKLYTYVHIFRLIII